MDAAMTSPPSSSGGSDTLAADAVKMEDFHKVLMRSKRVLALLGAGLSASSGLPTFRGAGGLWRTYDAMDLATPEAFDRDPGLVWQFYSYRRHMALNVKPNSAHYALAEYARKTGPERFMCLSQNVDGLSQRAGHPSPCLQLLHGNLFDIKCTDFYCKYSEKNYDDPIVHALAVPKDVSASSPPESTLGNGSSGVEFGQRELDMSDERVQIPHVAAADLPHCPQCTMGILRPGVVWFGEMLPEKVIRTIDEWIVRSPTIDIIMVIGTSARVYPAAGYVQRARAKGAKVCVVNTEVGDLPDGGMMDGDWVFVGDAAELVPKLLQPVAGDVTSRAGDGN